MLIGTLTQSLEDYLEIIFRLLLTRKVARVRDIAKAKEVKTSSVTSALQRLAKEGLVDYKAREYVDLTEEGRELAFRISQRHEFLKRFLIDLLQVDADTAENDACAMEHAISVTTLDRFAAFSEFLTYCTKVDSSLVADFRDCWLTQTPNDSCEHTEECSVWRRKLALPKISGLESLTDMQPGEMGFISRIIADEDDRKGLIQRGLLPSAPIKLLHKDADTVELEVSGRTLHLSEKDARAVFVWVEAGVLPDDGSGMERKLITMADLKPGNAFRVHRLTAKGEIRQRLIDMGFVKGLEGSVIREALLRDPIEIELKGYFLSLRRAEARDIVVEALNG